ncbi:MAG: protein O-GlcNAcase [Ardenticatenaceae bacterium]|nr:protein O-GlcNAcase [Ardenticatenaceae bacterium]
MKHSLFQVRGVIEGFYGVFYTFPERNDLIRFIGRHGYNVYIYGPKNDRQHRARWREPYPDQIMDQFAQTVAIAQEAGVTFCYAISPIASTPAQDFERLTAKLRSFFDIGVRAFCILLDDLVCEEQYEANRKIYNGFAGPHVEICNRLNDWLQAQDSTCTVRACPTEYYGKPPFSDYLHTLGEGLDPRIDLFYTGPKICSPEISRSDAEDFGRVAGRAPLIWDNYPVNDLDMKPEMHIGPIRGRDASLYQAVKGFVVNPMLQAEASKLPLLTFADYFADPHGYEPWASWQRALRAIGGETGFESLSLFAENSLRSCLDTVEAPALEALVRDAVKALQRGEKASTSQAVKDLESYINKLDEACYFLKNGMTNLPLRANLLPWIEALEDWIWVGKRAILVLQRLETGEQYEQPFRWMEHSADEIRKHTKRIAGNSLLTLIQYVVEQVEQRERARVEAAGEQAGRSLAA